MPITNPNQLSDQGVPEFAVQSNPIPEHGIHPISNSSENNHIAEANENQENKESKENFTEDYIQKIKDIDVEATLKDTDTDKFNSKLNVKSNQQLVFDSPLEIKEENNYQQTKNASFEGVNQNTENFIGSNVYNKTINPDNLGIQSQNALNENIALNVNSTLNLIKNENDNLNADTENIKNNNIDNINVLNPSPLENLQDFLHQNKNESLSQKQIESNNSINSKNFDSQLKKSNVNNRFENKQSEQIISTQNFPAALQQQSNQNISMLRISDENLSRNFAKNVHTIHDFKELNKLSHLNYPNLIINNQANQEAEINPNNNNLMDRNANQSFFSSSINKSNSFQEKDMSKFLNESLEEKAFRDWNLRMQKQEEEFKNAVRQIRHFQSSTDKESKTGFAKDAEEIDLRGNNINLDQVNSQKNVRKSSTPDSKSSKGKTKPHRTSNLSVNKIDNKNISNDTSFQNVELTSANMYNNTQGNYQISLVNAEKNVLGADLLAESKAAEKARRKEAEAFMDRNLTDEQIKKTNERIFLQYCGYHFLILLLTIPIITFALILASSFKISEAHYFSAINNNWNSKLISTISTKGCENTKSNTLVQENWPGTQNGCNYYTYVKSGFCPRNSDCTNVNAKDEIPINFWRGERLCKDSQWESHTYLDLPIADKAQICPEKTRSCGTLDSEGNQLCVDVNKQCPIVSLAFFNPEDYNKVKDNLKEGQKIVMFSKGVIVYSNNEANFSDKSNITIPVEFKISPGQPCKNPTYANIGFPLYVLDKFAGKTKCLKYSDMENNLVLAGHGGKETSAFNNLNTNQNNNVISDNSNSTATNQNFYNDENWKLLDKTSLETIYIENGVAETLKALPLYPYDTIQHDTYLFSRGYIGIKNACLKDIQENKKSAYLLSDLQKISDFENSNSILTALQVMSIIATVISFIVLLQGIFLVSISKTTQKPYKNDRKTAWIYFAISIFAVSTLIGLFIANAILLSRTILSNYFPEIFGNNQCVDNFTVDLFNQLKPNMDFVRNAAIVGLVFSLLDLILYGLFYFVAFYSTCKSVYV